MIYNHKTTLDDFFDNDYFLGVLPQLNPDSPSLQLKGKERKAYRNKISSNKGHFSVNMQEILGMVQQLAYGGATRHYKAIMVALAGEEISVSGELKRNHKRDDVVDDIYNNIVMNKGLLAQMVSNYSMLKDAIEYSHNLKSKPHLYMSTTRTQLKNQTLFGSKMAGRTRFMTEIMMNLYFNDSFRPIQEKYGIMDKDMIRDRNLIRKYEYEKDRWERRVGKR